MIKIRQIISFKRSLYGMQGNKYKYLEKYPLSFMSPKQRIAHITDDNSMVANNYCARLTVPKVETERVIIFGCLYLQGPCLARVPDLLEVQSQDP